MIRKASSDDIPYVLDLFKKGLEEHDIEYHESYVLNKIIISYHQAPCFLLEEDGRICGMASLNIGILPFTGKPTLTDNMFYIEPEYRDLKRFSGLVEACKAFADDHNLPLRLDFISQNDEELRKRIFRMHGFKVSSVVGVYNG